MPAMPAFSNISTIIGEDGIERVTDFQLTEISFTAHPDAEPIVEPIREQPRSVCPACGEYDPEVSNGVMTCNECGCEARFGMNVVTSMVDFSELLENNVSNPCGEIKKTDPIKRYGDIVGDRRNRFKILDL